MTLLSETLNFSFISSLFEFRIWKSIDATAFELVNHRVARQVTRKAEWLEFSNRLSPIRDRESVWSVFFSKAAAMSTCVALLEGRCLGAPIRVYCASGLSRHLMHTEIRARPCPGGEMRARFHRNERAAASDIERVCVRERAEQDFRTATKVVLRCSLDGFSLSRVALFYSILSFLRAL